MLAAKMSVTAEADYSAQPRELRLGLVLITACVPNLGRLGRYPSYSRDRPLFVSRAHRRLHHSDGIKSHTAQGLGTFRVWPKANMCACIASDPLRLSCSRLWPLRPHSVPVGHGRRWPTPYAAPAPYSLICSVS